MTNTAALKRSFREISFSVLAPRSTETLVLAEYGNAGARITSVRVDAGDGTGDEFVTVRSSLESNAMPAGRLLAVALGAVLATRFGNDDLAAGRGQVALEEVRVEVDDEPRPACRLRHRGCEAYLVESRTGGDVICAGWLHEPLRLFELDALEMLVGEL